LTLVGGRLFVGDFTGQRVLEFDVGTGAVIGELAGVTGRFSALAAGVSKAVVPYVLRLEPVEERLAADGRVELVVRARLYDGGERLMHTNDHTRILFAVAGGEEQTVQVNSGEAEAVFALDPGSEVRIEARVLGLETVILVRRIVAPATHVMMHFTETTERLIEVEIELFDGTDNLAIEDTSAVYFSVLRGLGVIVGPALEGKARTWVQVEGRDTDLVVAARVRSIIHSAGFQVSAVANTSPAAAGGLAVSARRLGGRDQFPPAPPTQVQALRQQDQVEIRWALSHSSECQ
jgi:hypothetical protein